MTIRPTTSLLLSMVERQISMATAKNVRAQEQIASGRRILRTADDPVGAAQAGSYTRQIAANDRYLEAIRGGRSVLDAGAANLESVSGNISEARSILIEGMNATKSADDRALLADQIDLIRDRLLDLANSRFGDRYLYSGTKTQTEPFVQARSGGRAVVEYQGNRDEQRVLAGPDFSIGIGLPGSDVFASLEPTGTRLSGLTGIASGISADQGTGYDTLDLRHDATVGTPGSGVLLTSGGSLDTILGPHTLTIDSVNGTVQLDGGTAVPIPAAGDPSLTDFTVTNSAGAEVHLDFSAYDGTSSVAALNGQGSISIDDTNYVPLTFAETDLELIDPATGSVVHVDTTGVQRSGRELLTFGGTVNVFDALEGIANDLRNGDGLDQSEITQRLGDRLRELDRNSENVRQALGDLGSRSARLTSLEGRIEDSNLRVEGLLSSVRDVDFSQAVIDMSTAQTTLETVQATGARMLQNSLLNFLR